MTDQSGIFAGKGGYDIYVGNNTDLKGAVIASEAEDKSKNKPVIVTQARQNRRLKKGELIIRNKEQQKQDINELSRDTENANNPLKQIFDK